MMAPMTALKEVLSHAMEKQKPSPRYEHQWQPVSAVHLASLLLSTQFSGPGAGPGPGLGPGLGPGDGPGDGDLPWLHLASAPEKVTPSSIPHSELPRLMRK